MMERLDARLCEGAVSIGIAEQGHGLLRLIWTMQRREGRCNERVEIRASLFEALFDP